MPKWVTECHRCPKWLCHFFQIHKASTAGQLFEGNIQTLQTWHKPGQVKSSKAFNQPWAMTQHFTHCFDEDYAAAWYEVRCLNHFSHVLPEDFSKNECVQNCHRVMAWPAWKRAICTTPIPPARDGLPAAHWMIFVKKKRPRNIKVPPILPGCNLLVRLR